MTDREKPYGILPLTVTPERFIGSIGMNDIRDLALPGFGPYLEPGFGCLRKSPSRKTIGARILTASSRRSTIFHSGSAQEGSFEGCFTGR